MQDQVGDDLGPEFNGMVGQMERSKSFDASQATTEASMTRRTIAGS